MANLTLEFDMFTLERSCTLSVKKSEGSGNHYSQLAHTSWMGIVKCCIMGIKGLEYSCCGALGTRFSTTSELDHKYSWYMV